MRCCQIKNREGGPGRGLRGGLSESPSSPRPPVNETVPRRHPGLTAQQSAPALRLRRGSGRRGVPNRRGCQKTETGDRDKPRFNATLKKSKLIRKSLVNRC